MAPPREGGVIPGGPEQNLRTRGAPRCPGDLQAQALTAECLTPRCQGGTEVTGGLELSVQLLSTVGKGVLILSDLVSVAPKALEGNF